MLLHAFHRVPENRKRRGLFERDALVKSVTAAGVVARLAGFEARDSGSKVSAEGLSSTGMVAPLFLAPSFPGGEKIFRVYLAVWCHGAAVSNKGADRRGQLLKRLDRLRRGHGLNEVSAAL